MWNEPNLNGFFDGTQEDYFHLYEMTARSLKAVDPCLQVGGPATSVNSWIPEFRSFCESNHVPYGFITHTIAYNDGLVKGYSFWTVSDIFEEMGMKPGPFKNEFGIQTNHGVAKPSYRIFQAPHEAGDVRVDVPRQDGSLVEVLALKNGDEATVFVYNHDLERRAVKAEPVELELNGAAMVWKAVIDEDHCSPLKAWQDMGSPDYLSREQVAALHKASELVYGPVEGSGVTFTAEPESVTIFKVRLS